MALAPLVKGAKYVFWNSTSLIARYACIDPSASIECSRKQHTLVSRPGLASNSRANSVTKSGAVPLTNMYKSLLSISELSKASPQVHREENVFVFSDKTWLNRLTFRQRVRQIYSELAQRDITHKAVWTGAGPTPPAGNSAKTWRRPSGGGPGPHIRNQVNWFFQLSTKGWKIWP